MELAQQAAKEPGKAPVRSLTPEMLKAASQDEALRAQLAAGLPVQVASKVRDPLVLVTAMDWRTGIVCGLDQILINARIDDPGFSWYVRPEPVADGEIQRWTVVIVALPEIEIKLERATLELMAELRSPLRFGLVDEIIRVQDPALVPPRGSVIDPADYQGLELLAPDAAPGAFPRFDPVASFTVNRTADAVTLEHAATKSRITLAPQRPEIGARWAYRVRRSAGAGGPQVELEIVVGPGTAVKLAEPRPREAVGPQSAGGLLPSLVGWPPGAGLLEGGVKLTLLETQNPLVIPLPGRPWPDELWGYARTRAIEGAEHEYIESTAELVATTALDVGWSLAPILGDVIDWAEVLYALSTGKDRWGRTLEDWEFAVMIGGALLPFVTSSMMRRAGRAARSGARATTELGALARTLGRSREEIEALTRHLGTLPDAERAALADVMRSIGAGKPSGRAEAAIARRVLGEFANTMAPLSIKLPAEALGALPAARPLRATVEEIGKAAVDAAPAAGRSTPEAIAAAARWSADLIMDLLEQLRSWARSALQGMGFLGFAAALEGDFVVLYGIRSKIRVLTIPIGRIKSTIAEMLQERASRLELASLLRQGDLLTRIIRDQGGKLSETIGDYVAERAMRFLLPGAQQVAKLSGSGVFDQVWKLGNEFILAEAKGGAGKLGGRIWEETGKWVPQGDPRYVDAVLSSMKKKAKDGKIPLSASDVDELIKAHADGRLRYLLFETPKLDPGSKELLVNVSVFF